MRIVIICCIIFFMSSCTNSGENSGKMSTTSDGSEKFAINMNRIDPVCEMEYDTSWTDFTINNNDTVRFCSETCKIAFSGNPSKYMKK